MRWINSLERRFGNLAIPGLIRIVVAFNILVFLLTFYEKNFISLLELRPERIMHGEIWRLISFIFILPANIHSQFNILLVLLYLNLLWVLGEGLEQAWGSFKLNLFYLVGVVGTAAAAFFFQVQDATGFFLNMSLLFAFATLFPNFPVLVCFILPVRIKWLALFALGMVLLQTLGESDAARLTIVVSLANYLLFFGPEWTRSIRESGRTATRRQQFQMAQYEEADEALHHCKVCGATEMTAPEKEFRVSADGEEYCLTHLPSRQTGSDLPPPLPVAERMKDEG